MKLNITPSKLQGSLIIPPSKSHSIRALIFALLSKGQSTIHNLLLSPDIEKTLLGCELLGANINRQEGYVEMRGGDLIPRGLINVGNSGLAYRFFTAIAALGEYPTTITGDSSIQLQRPILPLVDALRQLGVTILGEHAPFTICGPIHPGMTIVEGEDSQFVSALLIAAAFASGPTEIFVLKPGELPWVKLTLDWFKRLNIPIESDHYTYFRLEGNAKLNGFSYTVPGDYSTSAFPIASALLSNSEITIHNLDANDVQGDKRLIDHLKQMGANIECSPTSVTVKQGGKLQGCTIDVNEIIDATPILAVIACFAEGTTKLVNARIARTKECDRLSVITTELRKMGATIEEYEDGLVILGSSLKGAELNAHADHRMGMALTVAALAAKGESSMIGGECIAKTYPTFVEHFQKLGAKIVC